ncbi:putative magnesium transporter [Clavispora lusitaniae]|uniref:Magnesium transporter n=1 Tax=Clavispora lusitaniae TaxID=36911 RepID=A0ACD0WN64_CLALS|nr:putative magnesium transporter [Clavispora lusitaniae]QFZ34676.1 putative magnesium transporter [Clavispora lusitaniae]QFZ40361.1 putative magnesium transporter [Clavispora lusitaniae]QFZ46041.1 putative magnesium transporter [Clavispora lusitaniae]QFZ51703.1 putative magnesium transporter [Clavispora lusitaniae]
MSDLESCVSSARIRTGDTPQPQVGEELNDHRNQPETLPPPDDTSDDEFLQPLSHEQTQRSQSSARQSRSNSRPKVPSEFPRFRKGSRSNSAGNNDLPPMSETRTNDSVFSASEANAGAHFSKRDRRPSRSSFDSEADSHASRSSQETEEDVCFPMLREHVRINGIDFDEIDDFINEERENELIMKTQSKMIAQDTAMRVESKATGNMYSPGEKLNKNAMKYTPKNILWNVNKGSNKKGSSQRDGSGIDPSDSSEEFIDDKRFDDDFSDNVKFGGTRISDGDTVLPERFSFFHSDNEETIHSPDLPSLISPDSSARELFKNGEGTWWLDVTCPTDSEMKTLAKAFGIHPLTAEDIRMQETREKVELFRSYYFVCFHTFEPDKESEDYLEPINVYIVVFREGVLTFHFSPISHPANVRRRVRQLREYVDVSADWLCYAMIDDITDSFAPVITAIEYEADAIDDSVLIATSINFSSMLRRIGESRRKVMTLMRLLSNKADVIRMFAKRCQDEAYQQSPTAASRVNLAGLSAGINSGNVSPPPSAHGISFGPGPGAPPGLMSATQFASGDRVQPRADIALYLGDIQDHVVTMFQNLSAYEKIFSRSHANYLAQLQVESFNANLTVTKILGNVTLIGTLLLPLNVITGLFGMNVRIPGQDGSNLGWFFGIVGFMVLMVVGLFIAVKLWLRHIEKGERKVEDSSKSIKSFGLKYKTKEAAKSIISFPNRYD